MWRGSFGHVLLLQESSLHSLSFFFVKTFLVYFIVEGPPSDWICVEDVH